MMLPSGVLTMNKVGISAKWKWVWRRAYPFRGMGKALSVKVPSGRYQVTVLVLLSCREPRPPRSHHSASAVTCDVTIKRLNES